LEVFVDFPYLFTLLEWEFGLPYEAREEYRKWSPDSFVENWKTPTLVIHGGKDMRVPETEGLATFTTLQRLKVPSKFLYFPDECHWVLKPVNSAHWYNTIFEWLNVWLK
jgi:dipeptidyl aminopeptidase/acylaminoacyl peptidase